MITLNIFQKNDKVLVKGIVSEVTVDENGVHKYRIKDGKSGLTFGTWYTGDEIVAQEDDDAACMTKEKKKDGFPSREEMLELANRRYPKGSDELNKLLSAKGFEAKSLEDLSDNQLKAIYSKYEGK